MFKDSNGKTYKDDLLHHDDQVRSLVASRSRWDSFWADGMLRQVRTLTYKRDNGPAGGDRTF
jgi:hypothetical protein